MWEASASYPCATTSPADARQFCAQSLTAKLGHTTSAQELIGTAQMIVSELLTNSVDAVCGHTELTLSIHDHLLRIAVRDDAPGIPTLRNPEAVEERGRGLMIVAALAAGWGVEPFPHGKQVWAELVLP
jgi:anti-sigma regulatory factor (Ser/Thr protein kinase)